MEPQSGKRGGRHAQPTAATITAGTPIQKIRDWLDPSLKKNAEKASPPAAVPQTTGQRIAREANRAVGRSQESLPRSVGSQRAQLISRFRRDGTELRGARC